MTALISLLILLVVIVLVFYVAKLVIDLLPGDGRLKNVMLALVAVILLVWFISCVFGWVPGAPHIRWS